MNSIYTKTVIKQYMQEDYATPKGKMILEQKAAAMGLSAEECRQIEDGTIEKLEKLNTFIKSIYQFYEEPILELREEDKEEIEELAQILDIPENMIEELIASSVTNLYRLHSANTNALAVIQGDDVTAVDATQDTTEYSISIPYGAYKIQFTEEIYQTKLVAFFLKNIGDCYRSFKEQLYDFSNPNQYTLDNLQLLFDHCFADFVQQLHQMCLEQKLYGVDYSADSLLELLYPAEINAFSQHVNSLCENAQEQIETFRAYNSTSSGGSTMAMGSIPFMLAVGAMNAIGEAGDKIAQNSENKAYANQMISKVMACIENELDDVISTCIHQSIEEYNGFVSNLSNKESFSISSYLNKVTILNNYIENAASVAVDDAFIQNFINVFCQIPFHETHYLFLHDKIDDVQREDRLSFLEIGTELCAYVNNSNISKYYKASAKKHYKDSLLEIKHELPEEKWSSAVTKVYDTLRMSNLTHTAFDIEYDVFSRILSPIDLHKISEKKKLKVAEKEIKQLDGSQSLAVIGEKWDKVLKTYCMENVRTIELELSKFGTVFNLSQVEQLNQEEGRDIAKKGLETIALLALEDETLIARIKHLKSILKVPAYVFWDYEYTVFNKIYTTDKSNEREADFICIVLSSKIPQLELIQNADKGLSLSYITDLRIEGRPLLLCENRKQGILVTSKYLYASHLENPISLAEITKIRIENTLVKNNHFYDVEESLLFFVENKIEKVETNYLYNPKVVNSSIKEVLFLLNNALEFENIELETVKHVEEDCQEALEGMTATNKFLNKCEINGTFTSFECVEKTMEHVSVDFLKSKLFLANDNAKTQKKIYNAQATYARVNPNEKILAIFDDTLFGSAKKGFLVSDKAIYASYPSFAFMGLDDISSISFDNRNTLKMNDIEFPITNPWIIT